MSQESSNKTLDKKPKTAATTATDSSVGKLAGQGTTPTQDLWVNYEAVYDYLNQELFEGQLPQVILNFATHGKSNGYFTPARWSKKAVMLRKPQRQRGRPKKVKEQLQTAHELSLNPVLLQAPVQDCLSWLVRLMVQLWVYERNPKQTQQGYFSKAFSAKMWELGVPATRDGTPAGPKTGFAMQHWIEKDGKFQRAIDGMPEEWFAWIGQRRLPVKQKKKPLKYGCPNCGTIITTGKLISAICTTENCNEPFKLISS